jgi:hypothetical protein
MLISLILTLTPEAPAALPPELGRAVQAEMLARLGQVDPRWPSRSTWATGRSR